MNLRNWVVWAAALSAAVMLVAHVPSQEQAPAQRDGTAAQEGVEVLARGPVHEAFAEPTQARPQPSEIVPKKPPDPVDEIPPEEKPAGDHVVWIPGYWAWDTETKDYLWVSGFWRVPPPERQWVPGSWQEVDGGWQWVAGYWAPASQQEVTYLPAPPPSIDEGASTPAPDDNSAYVPGCWVYRDTRYLWRPGFWNAFRPGWVWIPAHYVWTPAGFVFVDGFWDVALDQRGLLFAPVRFRRNLLGADFVFVPRFVVQTDFLISALFVRTAFNHFFFGDFFEDAFVREGFVPWFDFRIARGVFDPNFVDFRHRFGNQWDRNLRGFYAGRFSGEIARPPRTLDQQNTVITNITKNQTQNTVINKNINVTNLQSVSALVPLTKINNTKVTGLASLGGAEAAKKVETHVIKTQPVSREQQAEARKAVTQFRETAQQRHQAEAKILSSGGAPVKATDPPKSTKIELPKAPTFPAPQGTQPAAPPPKPPPAPKQPAHEEKPIPKHEPPKAPAPPKQVTPSPPKEPPKSPPPAPKEAPPPPKEPAKPPPKEPPPPTKEPPKPAPAPPKEPPREAPKPPPKEPPKPPSKDKEPPKDKEKPPM